MSELNFYYFEDYLIRGKFEEAKSLVTPANAQTRDGNGFGVLRYLCRYAPDDPGLLYHFIKLGATLELDSAGKFSSPLHQTAYYGKIRLMRALLDLGIPGDILDQSERTPLQWSLRHYQKECVHLLLDRGAKLSLVKKDYKIPQWARDLSSKREKMRISSVIILGLLHCKSKVTGKSGKDVLRMVARATWSLRGL